MLNFMFSFNFQIFNCFSKRLISWGFRKKWILVEIMFLINQEHKVENPNSYETLRYLEFFLEVVLYEIFEGVPLEIGWHVEHPFGLK